MSKGGRLTREELAQRMYERVNGTDPTKPWCPGGWAGCDRILAMVYLRCADTAMELLGTEGSGR